MVPSVVYGENNLPVMMIHINTARLTPVTTKLQ